MAESKWGSIMTPRLAKPRPRGDGGTEARRQGRSETMPLAEVEKKLGSSPDGLSQAEAQKRLTQYGPNEIAEKKTNPFLKFLTYFWGPIPWMIEGAVILSGVVRHWLGFLHHSRFCCVQRRGRILGGAPGGQRDRRAEGQAGDQGHGEARWEVGRPGGARTGARRRHPSAPGRHRAGGRAPAGGRSGGGGSVRVDRRIVARDAQARRGGVFGIDHPAGRDRRAGLRHRARTPTSARPRSWCRRRTPSAISSAPCSRSAIT